MDTQTQERLEDLLKGFDHSALLPFLACCPNNVGDPSHDSNFLCNTHDMERARTPSDWSMRSRAASISSDEDTAPF